MKIPASFPVRVLAPGDAAECRATCGACGRSWDDAIATDYTPAPSGRCPFEYYHAAPRAPRKTRARFRPGDHVRLTDPIQAERDLVGLVLSRVRGAVCVQWAHVEGQPARRPALYQPRELTLAAPRPGKNRAWLRMGSDSLEQARAFLSVTAARDAFADTARDLARIGQSLDGSIHLAPDRASVVEYPDYVLSIGPRGGVHLEKI